jgi:hypothetical protein
MLTRRQWARRVIKKAGFPSRSREASLLTDLLRNASRANSKQLPIPEQVLVAALRLVDDKTVVIKLAQDLAVSSVKAERDLARLPKAAIVLAAENNMNSFLQLANRNRIP